MSSLLQSFAKDCNRDISMRLNLICSYVWAKAGIFPEMVPDTVYSQRLFLIIPFWDYTIMGCTIGLVWENPFTQKTIKTSLSV